MAKGHKSTVTHAADSATTGMQNSTYDAARKAASGYSTVGPDQNTLAAMGLFGDYANAGRTGMNALAGDQDATNSLMNPYLHDVIGGVNTQYGLDSAQLRKNVNDATTQAGAFGGDRGSLEQGAAQGALSVGHQQQVGDLLHGGYNEMLARAAGLAGMGMNAGQAQFAGGDYLRNIAQEQANPDVARARLLGTGLQQGNVGNYSDTNYTKTGAMQNILGGAATIGGLFGGMPGLGSAWAGLFGPPAGGNAPPTAGGGPINMGNFGGGNVINGPQAPTSLDATSLFGKIGAH